MDVCAAKLAGRMHYSANAIGTAHLHLHNNNPLRERVRAAFITAAVACQWPSSKDEDRSWTAFIT
jgi:hypothetical protein